MYTLGSSGSSCFDDGWNCNALVVLVVTGTLAIGLALLGAYGVIFNVGNWGWLIGAAASAFLHVALSARRRPRLAAQVGE